MKYYSPKNELPFVFLHGFLGTSSDWEPVCSYLHPYTCICIDLPGHGKTPFTEYFFNLMPQIPKMHLIGYSMGGRLAMQYAAAFPSKIESLTILSAHCGIKDPYEKQKRLELDRNWAKKITLSFDDFLKEWYDQPIFGGFIPNLNQRKTGNQKDLARCLVYYSLGKQDLLEPKNATFIVGERDLKYRSLYPSARVVPNAGHMVHLEQPSLIADLIREKIL